VPRSDSGQWPGRRRSCRAAALMPRLNAIKIARAIVSRLARL
jgi:hypothetical protein